MPRPVRFALVVCVLALTAAACGGDDASESTTTTTTQAAPTTSSTTKAPATTTTQLVDTTEFLLEAKWTNTVDGKFEASGGAVDAGVVCTDGRMKFSAEVVEEDPGKWIDSVAESEFTCSDDSGTFITESTYHTVISGENSSIEGQWEIVSGTGAYAALEGEGDIEAKCSVGCDGSFAGAVTP